MSILHDLLEFGLDLFNKAGGAPSAASGATLIGTLLYNQYNNESWEIFWDTLISDGWEKAEEAQRNYMAEKLDMTPQEFEQFKEDPRADRSLDGAEEWKRAHPDPMDVLVDMVMGRTGGR